jgi:hypothetical protein
MEVGRPKCQGEVSARVAALPLELEPREEVRTVGGAALDLPY